MGKRKKLRPIRSMNGEITSLEEFFKAFPDESSCEDYLFKIQHPRGYICPRCGNQRYGRIEGRREFQCTRCKHQASLTRGTLMHRTHLPLRKWFLAIYLVTCDKRGISAVRIMNELKVRYETAYHLLVRIRAAMALSVIPNVLGGELELDDAYIGSKGDVKGRGTTKAPFIVAVEKSKGGAAALRATRRLSGDEYKMFARDHISRSSHIASDCWNGILAGLSSFPGLDAQPFSEEDGRTLPVVHHLISNFKAMVKGTYHGIHKECLQGYLDEFSYRYANRHNADVFCALITDICLSTRRARPYLTELFAIQNAEGIVERSAA